MEFTTFEVEETFKDVYSMRNSGRVSLYRPEHNCAASFAPGRRYLVYAWRTDGLLAQSSYCAANEIVTDDSESLARVRTVASTWSPEPPQSQEGRGLDEQATGDALSFFWWSVGLNVFLGAALLLAFVYRRGQAS